MTRTQQLLWLALACVLTVAAVLALGQLDDSGAQEAPPPTIGEPLTCTPDGVCLILALSIDCDEHAGTGCPPPAPEPVPATPQFTG